MLTLITYMDNCKSFYLGILESSNAVSNRDNFYQVSVLVAMIIMFHLNASASCSQYILNRWLVELYWTSLFIFLQKLEKQCHVPFQAVGRTLGSSAPAATKPTVNPTPLNTASGPSIGLVVDETLPSTSVQLRLVDGTGMIAHFIYKT